MTHAHTPTAVSTQIKLCACVCDVCVCSHVRVCVCVPSTNLSPPRGGWYRRRDFVATEYLHWQQIHFPGQLLRQSTVSFRLIVGHESKSPIDGALVWTRGGEEAADLDKIGLLGKLVCQTIVPVGEIVSRITSGKPSSVWSRWKRRRSRGEEKRALRKTAFELKREAAKTHSNWQGKQVLRPYQWHISTHRFRKDLKDVGGGWISPRHQAQRKMLPDVIGMHFTEMWFHFWQQQHQGGLSGGWG